LFNYILNHFIKLIHKMLLFKRLMIFGKNFFLIFFLSTQMKNF